MPLGTELPIARFVWLDSTNRTQVGRLTMTLCENSPSGQTSCNACPPGTQAPQDGSSICTSCPSGTFGLNNALNGTASCTPCQAGHSFRILLCRQIEIFDFRLCPACRQSVDLRGVHGRKVQCTGSRYMYENLEEMNRWIGHSLAQHFEILCI